MFGASRQLSLKSWKICAPQRGAVIYFPFCVPDSERSANIELNGPWQSSFLRSIISWWLGVLSNSISSSIYQSQLRFTFALADVNGDSQQAPEASSAAGLSWAAGVIYCIYFHTTRAALWAELGRCSMGFGVFLPLALQPLRCKPGLSTQLRSDTSVPPQL